MQSTPPHRWVCTGTVAPDGTRPSRTRTDRLRTEPYGTRGRRQRRRDRRARATGFLMGRSSRPVTLARSVAVKATTPVDGSTAGFLGRDTVGLPGRHLRGRHRIDRDQLDVEVTEQLKGAVQTAPGRKPSRPDGSPAVTMTDIEPVDGRGQGGAQPAPDHDFKFGCTQVGSFAYLDGDNLMMRVTGVRCVGMEAGVVPPLQVSSCNGSTAESSSLEGDRAPPDPTGATRPSRSDPDGGHWRGLASDGTMQRSGQTAAGDPKRAG